MRGYPLPAGISWPMVSGRWYDQQTSGIYNPGTSSYGTGRVWFVPFTNWSQSRALFSRLGMDLDANAGPDVTANLAVYRNDNGVPTTKIMETQLILPNGGSGTPQIDITLMLPPGLYWLALTLDGTVDLGDWDTGASAEGFSLLGDSNPAGSQSIPKAWGYMLPFPFAPLPDNASVFSFAGQAFNTAAAPRICLQVG
jgi:hypothetical protein